MNFVSAGKAEKVLASIPPVDSLDSEKGKAANLGGYELVPEASVKRVFLITPTDQLIRLLRHGSLTCEPSFSLAER